MRKQVKAAEKVRRTIHSIGRNWQKPELANVKWRDSGNRHVSAFKIFDQVIMQISNYF